MIVSGHGAPSSVARGETVLLAPMVSAYVGNEQGRAQRSESNTTFMHDFPQPGALPIVLDGEVIGSMGVSSADGEKCAQAAIDAVFKKQGTPPAP